jgi:hypothetical protein
MRPVPARPICQTRNHHGEQRVTQKEVLALIPVCGMAVLLRLWGIGFGLPYDFHPDEPTVIETAFRMASSGDLNPHFFVWPFLFFSLNAFS